MRMVVRIIITAFLMGGGVRFGDQPSLYYRMLKAMVLKIDEGLPPLEPFTQKMTGKKLPY